MTLKWQGIIFLLVTSFHILCPMAGVHAAISAIIYLAKGVDLHIKRVAAEFDMVGGIPEQFFLHRYRVLLPFALQVNFASALEVGVYPAAEAIKPLVRLKVKGEKRKVFAFAINKEKNLKSLSTGGEVGMRLFKTAICKKPINYFTTIVYAKASCVPSVKLVATPFFHSLTVVMVPLFSPPTTYTSDPFTYTEVA